MAMAHKLLNLEEAARFLAISPKNTRAMCMNGELPCIWQGERPVFDQAELDLWLSQQMVLQKNDTRSYARKTNADKDIVLSSFCSVETTALTLQGKTRASILKNLVTLAESSGLLYNPDDLYEQIRKREEEGATAMENGVALVHPAERDEFMFEDSFICIARAERPVFFGEVNGVPTDIFILIACVDSNTHVKILAKLCQLFLETDLLTQWRQAEDEEMVLAALKNAEAKLAGDLKS